ncbi:Hypothetical predicted protein [Marmota monax]|uniref:Kinesin motor domain-containing protein n=1 Tax=Marmota monax TaxID=9995 RepID=A0A5E4BVE8_MARMO|nr:Hypothetical predicted protein [Marmota monax]
MDWAFVRLPNEERGRTSFSLVGEAWRVELQEASALTPCPAVFCPPLPPGPQHHPAPLQGHAGAGKGWSTSPQAPPLQPLPVDHTGSARQTRAKLQLVDLAGSECAGEQQRAASWVDRQQAEALTWGCPQPGCDRPPGSSEPGTSAQEQLWPLEEPCGRDGGVHCKDSQEVPPHQLPRGPPPKSLLTPGRLLKCRVAEGAPVLCRETSFINRSLAALADVLGALSERRGHVPYRNSKLTHLLQDTIGSSPSDEPRIENTGWLVCAFRGAPLAIQLGSGLLGKASHLSLHHAGLSSSQGHLLHEPQAVGAAALLSGVRALGAASGPVSATFLGTALCSKCQWTLWGDAKLLVILCVSPGQKHVAETLQGLGFGARARQAERGQAGKRPSCAQVRKSCVGSASR